MKGKSSTFVFGIVAVGIYFLLVSVLLFYFNTRHTQKSVHYVKKNENRIRVSLGGPKSKPKKKDLPKKETVKKKKAVKKERVKKQKDRRKKVIKEKIVKKAKKSIKKEPIKKEPIKKVNKPKDLFASIKTKKKAEKSEVKKPVSKKKVLHKPKEKSASELFSESLKVQKRSDSGIENAYLAEIEEKLKGWPAQSDYAGQRVKVWIKVETDGHFIFKIRSASSNDTFNKALIIYLKQLQKFGFGPHKGGRAYELDVEFIAKE